MCHGFSCHLAGYREAFVADGTPNFASGADSQTNSTATHQPCINESRQQCIGMVDGEMHATILVR